MEQKWYPHAKVNHGKNMKEDQRKQGKRKAQISISFLEFRIPVSRCTDIFPLIRHMNASTAASVYITFEKHGFSIGLLRKSKTHDRNENNLKP